MSLAGESKTKPVHAFLSYASGEACLTLDMSTDTFNALTSSHTPVHKKLKYAIENIDALKNIQNGQSLMDTYIASNHPHLVPLYNQLLRHTVVMAEDQLPNPDDFNDFKRGDSYHIPMLPEFFPGVLVPIDALPSRSFVDNPKESIGNHSCALVCGVRFRVDGQPMSALSIKHMLQGLAKGEDIRPHASPGGRVNVERVKDTIYVENTCSAALRKCQEKFGVAIHPNHIASMDITGVGIYPHNIVKDVRYTI